jgi:hypothetical protein
VYSSLTLRPSARGCAKRRRFASGRRATTYDAGLPRYKLAVFLVPQTDSPNWQASSAADGFSGVWANASSPLGRAGCSGRAGGISTASPPESSRGTAASETSGLGDVAPGLVTAGSSLEDAFSIAPSFARKLISTRWASSVVNLFLSGNADGPSPRLRRRNGARQVPQPDDRATLRIDRGPGWPPRSGRNSAWVWRRATSAL